MSLVFQDQSGLAQGISHAGSSISQALQKNAQTEKYKQAGTVLQGLIEDAGPDMDINKFQSVMSAAISQGVDPGIIKLYSDTYTPYLKTKALTNASQDIKNKYKPINKTQDDNIRSTPQNPQDLREEGMKTSEITPSSSPISKINEFKKPIVQEDSQVIETPAGTFAASEFIDTPEGRFHPMQVAEMFASPNPADQRQAKSIHDYIVNKENYKYKDQIQKSKEARNEIKEFSKPYQDIPKLTSHVKKLEKAKDIILKGNVNLNDNWMRTVVQSILQETGAPSYAELVKSEDAKILYSLIYDSLRTKDLGGSNPSTREVLLSLAAKPNEYKGIKANLTIINDMIRESKENLYKGESIAKIRSRDGDISFGNFQLDLASDIFPKMQELDKKFELDDKILDAKILYKGKRPKSGYSYIMKPDGQVVEVPKSDVKMLIDEHEGVLINGK